MVMNALLGWVYVRCEEFCLWHVVCGKLSALASCLCVGR